MSPVLIVAYCVVAALVGLLILIATRPAEFQIQRSGEIPASPEQVFALISDFRNWTKWSPWEKLDPEMKRTYSGSSRGVGSKYEWVGNKKVGQGKMSIMSSVPGRRVEIDLEFIKPFPASNQTIFEMTKSETGCRLVWTMKGKNTFMGKAFGLIMNMDKMIGKDFERGISNLQEVVKP